MQRNGKTNLPRATVFRSHDVTGADDGRNVPHIGRADSGLRNGAGEARGDRLPRSETLLLEAMEAKDESIIWKRKYNCLREGYAVLLNAYAEQSIELSLAKGEPVGYPLMLPDAVTGDVIDAIMARMSE